MTRREWPQLPSFGVDVLDPDGMGFELTAPVPEIAGTAR